MKNGYIKTLWFIVFMVIISISVFSAGTVSASESSAALSLSGGGSFEVGKTVTIGIKYTGADFGAATGRVSYDSSVLEYESCSGGEAFGNGGYVTYTMSSGSGTKALSCKLVFKTKKTGSTDISVSTSDVYNLDLEELSSGSKSVSVTVKDSSRDASTNANLSTLSVSAGTLTPGFSKDVTAYTVEVSNSVTTCTVSANKDDSKATVAISGSSNLSVGKNIRKVTVTAERGKTKTYTITITRKAADGSQAAPSQNEQVEKNSIETVVGSVNYTVCENITEEMIPEGFELSVANYNDNEIPVIRDSERDIILGLLTEKGKAEPKWLFYNEKKNSFYEEKNLTAEQLFTYYEKDEVDLSSPVDTPAPEPVAEKTSQDSVGLLMLYALVCTVGILLIIVIILQVRVIKGKKKGDK